MIFMRNKKLISRANCSNTLLQPRIEIKGKPSRGTVTSSCNISQNCIHGKMAKDFHQFL